MDKPMKYGCEIFFSDNSRGFMDYDNFKFYTENYKSEFIICRTAEYLRESNIPYPSLYTAFEDYVQNMLYRIKYPNVEFKSCFRRKASTTQELVYSHRFKDPPVDVLDINKIYQLKSQVFSGMFSPRMEHYYLCDGEIYCYIGYGFGPRAKSYIEVRGEIALRALCIFFGIKQPAFIKGYPKLLNDSEILYQLTQTVKVEPD